MYDTSPQPYAQVYLMNRDGTKVRQVTDSKWEDSMGMYVRAPKNGSQEITMALRSMSLNRRHVLAAMTGALAGTAVRGAAAAQPPPAGSHRRLLRP